MSGWWLLLLLWGGGCWLGVLVFWCLVVLVLLEWLGAFLFFESRFGLSAGFCGEFDPGSGRTLAACLTHASRTMKLVLALVD